MFILLLFVRFKFDKASGDLNYEHQVIAAPGITASIVEWSPVSGFFGVVGMTNCLSKTTLELVTIEDNLLRMHRLYGIKLDEEESVVRVLNVHDQTVWRNLPNRAERFIAIGNIGLVSDFDFLVHNSLLPD
jgi:hypothetical protein